MKGFLTFIGIFICGLFSFAQVASKADEEFFRKKEDSMKNYALQIIQGAKSLDRLRADSAFTRIFVRSLVNPNSFYHPFDSLVTISKLYAPDSSFRIFTWQLLINETVTRQHGAIQMRTRDGSLRLFPLIDKSDVTLNVADTTGNNKGWIGAVYYKIIQKQSSGVNFYTLLGFDENSIRSNRKIIEVLRFINDEPVFGGRYFSFENDKNFKSSISRYIMEYKKEAGPRLNYDPELDMILVEHLISESGQPNKKWTLVGDGDYEGFKWFNGKWVHVEKIFDQVLQDGKPPVPMPIRDAKGTIDDTKVKNNLPEEDKPQPPAKKKDE